MDQDQAWKRLEKHAQKLAPLVKDAKELVRHQDIIAAGLAFGNVMREAQAAYDLLTHLLANSKNASPEEPTV